MRPLDWKPRKTAALPAPMPRPSLWLCPIEDRRGLDSTREGMMQGFSLGSYVQLVDYTGRLFRQGKASIKRQADTSALSVPLRSFRSAIPPHCELAVNPHRAFMPNSSRAAFNNGEILAIGPSEICASLQLLQPCCACPCTLLT